MSDDPIDKGWDALPGYADKLGEADDAVTVSISTTPGEWLVNTVDAVVVPMSMIEVVEALRSQKLNERSLVWRAGMQEWAPVDRVPQLKLAARLPSVMPTPSAPPKSGAPPKPSVTPKPSVVPTPTVAVTASVVPPAATTTPRLTTKPPPKPARTASTPTQAAAPVPSRKATLPFGLPSPIATPSRLPAIATPSKPFQARPTPRPTLQPPPSVEDSEVLAVYARPAATISFDLSPEPVRTIDASATMPPQTLAPTTTDSAPRRVRVSTLPPPRAGDLSVVAASEFRQAQRFSKRLILASSLGSAAIASLITMWLSHSEAQHRAAAAPPAPVQTLAAPAAPAPPPPVVEPPPAVSPPEVVAEQAPEPTTKSKAKPKARARAWQRPTRAAAAAATEPVSASADSAPSEPKAEANPYDVQLDDDGAAKAKPPSATHGSGLDGEETATTAPSSPGF